MSWHQVEWAVHAMANSLKRKYRGRLRRAPGIYAPARGGLPLAVALSHMLNLPLLRTPRDGCVWVDDIYDSGLTYRRDKARAKRMMPCVWVAHHGAPVMHVRAVDDDVWTIFPWEDADKAAESARAYAISRQ